jgi:hypothetical protein
MASGSALKAAETPRDLARIGRPARLARERIGSAGAMVSITHNGPVEWASSQSKIDFMARLPSSRPRIIPKCQQFGARRWVVNGVILQDDWAKSIYINRTIRIRSATLPPARPELSAVAKNTTVPHQLPLGIQDAPIYDGSVRLDS